MSSPDPANDDAAAFLRGPRFDIESDRSGLYRFVRLLRRIEVGERDRRIVFAPSICGMRTYSYFFLPETTRSFLKRSDVVPDSYILNPSGGASSGADMVLKFPSPRTSSVRLIGSPTCATFLSVWTVSSRPPPTSPEKFGRAAARRERENGDGDLLGVERHGLAESERTKRSG